jgi:DNA-binding GntR family transcriptional regulator
MRDEDAMSVLPFGFSQRPSGTSLDLGKRRAASMNITFQKVAPVSKKDCVNRLLKEAIVSGAIVSGDQIVEAEVARQFGVGQGVAREALLELEYQGLVQRAPFSNTRVATLSDQDVGHICDIRIELEPLAFERAGRILGPNDVVHLRKLIAQAKEAATSGDLAGFFDNHLAFFRKVWELSGNKYLRQTLERLVVPLFALYLTRGSFKHEELMQIAVACVDRHEQIIHTFQAGDTCEVKRMVSDCLIQMKEIIVSKGGRS